MAPSSRQLNNIAAPAIVAAARRRNLLLAAARQTSILAKNAAAALLARGTSFPTATEILLSGKLYSSIVWVWRAHF